MPSTRVWTLAGVAGVVVFVWSLLAAGVTYDARRVRIEMVTQALARAPDDIVAWNDLASLIVNAEDRESALARWLGRAPSPLLHEQAGHAMLLYRMGARLGGSASADAFASVIEQLETFTRDHPELAQAHHWHTLTHVYRQTDQPEKALAAAQHTEALASAKLREDPSPNLATVFYWLGFTRHEMGDAAGGRRGWALLVELMDQTGELQEQGRQYSWNRLAEIARSVGDNDTAAACLARFEEKLASASEKRTLLDPWHELGWRWSDVGKEEEAKRVWRRLAQLQEEQVQADPDSATARYNLACYRALAGQTQSALRAWRDSIALGWSNPGYANGDKDLDPIRTTPEFAQSMIELITATLESGAAAEGQAELLYVLSRYQAVAGDAPGALRSLAGALDAGFLDHPRLRDDPLLALLADQPQFGELLEQVEARFETWRERRQRRSRRPDQEGERS